MWKHEISKRDDDYSRKIGVRRQLCPYATPVYSVLNNYEKTNEQLEKLKQEHFKKIELSDAILVINKEGYIGNSTKFEIEYAKKLDKEVMYLQ